LQECILSAPLGVSRLVGVLDDTRDAVRNAGLVLLVDLTSGANEDLRKIVAFEDVFGRIFSLIQTEGGLVEAGITAQDCLSLLANLIKGSPSNQTMFRESGCVTQLSRLLAEAFPPSEPESVFAAQARERAAWGLLQLLGLFLEAGETSTAQNQAAFFRAGAAQVLSDLGFSAELPTPIRVLALKGVASLIASNPPLQEAFAASTVETPSENAGTPKPSPQANGTKSGHSSARGSARASAESPRTYIIEALLDLTLNRPLDDTALRAAACGLIQAYLANHDRVKAHFLQRAIAGHTEHEDASNVLITLLRSGAEPNSVIFASWIVSDLIADEPEAKEVLATVKEGNESEGEDVLTSIQALGSQLQAALQSADERLIAAYAGLLTVFLWDFADGVNNLLSEGSGLIQALVAAANPASGDIVTAGLSATLLGTIYEFSTKDSPIPRRTLAPLLTQKLGRSKYLDSLSQLRRDPAIRDFDIEVGEQEGRLSTPFVDLFQLEYSRLRKAIDKDPGLEVLPASAAEAGVDRDVLDDLRQQLQTTKDALSQAQQDALTVGQQAEQDRMAVAKELQTAAAEVDRLRRINQAMQTGHESELEKLAQQHEQGKQQINAEHQRIVATAKQEAEQQTQNRLREQGAASAQKIQEYERRIAELGNSHRSEQQKHNETARQLEALTARHAELGTAEQEVRRQYEDVNGRYAKMEREHQALQAEAEGTKTELERVRKESENRQELVTRLTTQIKELRDDLKGKEDELANERSGFSELEKELDAAKASLAEADKKASDAEARVKGAEARAESSKPTKADTEKLATLEKRVKELEAQVAEAKDGEKSAKEELDSLFLVMSDLEAKRDGYKAKVKELGGEATESEGEDDEEDEDDDREEGEE